MAQDKDKNRTGRKRRSTYIIRDKDVAAATSRRGGKILLRGRRLTRRFGLHRIAVVTEADRDAYITEALRELGFRAEHASSIRDLRVYQQALRAVGVLYEAFGRDLLNFLDRPLPEYGGLTTRQLTREHGVRALQALRSDVQYPTYA